MKTRLALLLFVFCIASQAYGLNVEISPSTVTLPEAGETFQIMVRIYDVDDFGGFEFDILYDPSVVRIQTNADVTMGDIFDGLGGATFELGPVINHEAGVLTFGAVLYGSEVGASGGGALATIEFTVVSQANGLVDLDNVQLAPLQSVGPLAPEAIDDTVLIGASQPYGHIVQFTADPGGKLTGDPVQTVSDGGKASAVMAVADDGYAFIGWRGDHTGNENPLKLENITSDMTVTAEFEALPSQPHSVIYTVSGNGAVSGNANQIEPHGADAEAVTAVPEDGHRFTGWTGDYTGAENPLQLTDVSTDITVTANFEPFTYRVVFSVQGEGTLTGETVQTVTHGADAAPVTALPAQGYIFSGWTGDVAGMDNPLTLTEITSDMNVAAVFNAESIRPYQVTFSTNGNGSLTGEQAQAVGQGGDTTPVMAVPDDGYAFTYWSGDVMDTDNPLTLTDVNANLTVIANFDIKTYQITLSAGPGGSITPEREVTVSHGDNLQIEITPEKGYFVEDVLLDDDSLGTASSQTISDIQSDHTVLAIFANDGDGDGVPDTVDEFPDNQALATPTATNGTSGFLVDVTLDPNAWLTDVQALSKADLEAYGIEKPAGYTFQDAFLTFTIHNVPKGGMAQVIIEFPSGIPENAKCFKLDDRVFYEYTDAVFDGNQLLLTLTDGGLGDADGVSDGVIIDPVGLAVLLDDAREDSSEEDEGSGGGGGSCFIGSAGSQTAERFMARIASRVLDWVRALQF